MQWYLKNFEEQGYKLIFAVGFLFVFVLFCFVCFFVCFSFISNYCRVSLWHQHHIKKHRNSSDKRKTWGVLNVVSPFYLKSLRTHVKYEWYYTHRDLFPLINSTPSPHGAFKAIEFFPLHWPLNERDGVSYHQPHDCLLNRLFRRRSKKTSKLHVTGLCVREFTGDRWIPPHKWLVPRKMFPFDDVIMPQPDPGGRSRKHILNQATWHLANQFL